MSKSSLPYKERWTNLSESAARFLRPAGSQIRSGIRLKQESTGYF